MMWGIRQKLLFVFTSITLLGGLGLFASAGRQLENAVLEFYQINVQTEAIRTASLLSETMEHYLDGESTNAELQQILERAQNAQNTVRAVFTLLNPDRRVLASTASPRYPLFEQVPPTAEVRVALEGRTLYVKRDNDSGEEYVYSGTPILYESRVIGVLQSAAPLAPAYVEARKNWIALARVAVPILLLTIAASLWFGDSLARRIQRLNTSALRIAEGAFDDHVPVTSPDEIGQLADSFNLMAERINNLLTAQRSFVSNAAHELRSPLANARLRVESLQAGSLTDEQRSAYLDQIAGEINQMSALISQLLALARLDEGSHPADQDFIDDIAAFLQDSARKWRIQLREAGLNFQADIGGPLPDVAIAANDLQIVLDNLISNAMKYTPAGGLVAFQASASARGVSLTVRDTGEGFTEEDAGRLFSRFFRVDRSRSKQVPGTGLGLSIVKSILEHYGGTITAQSDGPGQGAVFEVILPLAT